MFRVEVHEVRLPFLADIGVWRDAEMLNSCGSRRSARGRAVLALDGGAAEFARMDRREDIALLDRQGASEAVLALEDGGVAPPITVPGDGNVS